MNANARKNFFLFIDLLYLCSDLPVCGWSFTKVKFIEGSTLNTIKGVPGLHSSCVFSLAFSENSMSMPSS